MTLRQFSLVIICGILAVLSFLSVPAAAQGQSALNRLEQQIVGASTQRPLVEPGYLGAEMDDSQEGGQGIRILQVFAESPAEAAGLTAGDLITAVNREPVRSLETLAEVLSQFAAGTQLSFDVFREHPTRGSEIHKVQVTLSQRPDPARESSPELGLVPGNPSLMDVVEARFGLFGFSGRAIEQQLQNQGQAATLFAVQVTGVAEGSPAATGGLLAGDLIVQVDRTTIRTPGELAEVIQAQPQRASILVIVRDGVARQAELPPLAELAGNVNGDAAGKQTQRPGTLVLEPMNAGDQRIQQLEQRVAALEAQLRQLQQQLGGGN